MGFFVSETFLMEWVMIWLFDLDNTLHNASFAIFPEISANMNAFLSVYMKKMVMFVCRLKRPIS